MRRSDKYRLYPTRSQAVALNAMLGAFCDLYNAGLQQRIEAYQRQRKRLRYLDRANELKAVRLADDRLAGYSCGAKVLAIATGETGTLAAKRGCFVLSTDWLFRRTAD